MKYLIGTIAILWAVGLNAQEDTPAPEASDSLELSTAPGVGDTTIVRLGRHQLKVVERDGKDEILLEKQDKEDGEWETKEKFTPKTPDSPSDWSKKHMLTHWSGVTFGMNGFVGDNLSLDLPEEANQMELDYSKSYTFSLNFPEVKFRLIKDYVGIYTGLGLQFNSYRLRQNTNITFGSEMTLAEDTVRNFTRNTIQAVYLRVPLMLEFNTSLKPTRSFHVAAGVVGGIRVHSTYVQDYNLDGVDYSVNVQGIPNLNLFSGEAMVRVGYGPFLVYASYWLTPLFDKSEGPELYPFSAGIGFAF